ncbi:MAG: hypothetical protein HY053_08240 [Proteobacteria bacterium]|nr:hypothetical protein [Pseudomonadota bacterium]
MTSPFVTPQHVSLAIENNNLRKRRAVGTVLAGGSVLLTAMLTSVVFLMAWNRSNEQHAAAEEIANRDNAMALCITISDKAELKLLRPKVTAGLRKALDLIHCY